MSGAFDSAAGIHFKIRGGDVDEARLIRHGCMPTWLSNRGAIRYEPALVLDRVVVMIVSFVDHLLDEGETSGLKRLDVDLATQRDGSLAGHGILPRSGLRRRRKQETSL
jgi:hypothetical protein